MPLPEFWKRKRSATANSNLSKESPRNKTNDLENGKIYGLPLENISEELFSDATSDIFSLDPSHRTNGLAKSFSEVLSNPNALGYFIQFMESRSSVSLVKFCLDVMSFKASSTSINEQTQNGEDDFCSNDFGHFQSAVLPFEHFQPPCEEKVINGHCDKNSNCDEGHDGVSTRVVVNWSKNRATSKPDDTNSSNNIEHEQCPTSPSSESIDSGILVSQSESSPVRNGIFAAEPVHNSNNGIDSNANLTPEEQALINQTKDALAIYQRYVAPESPMEIDFRLDVKHSIVTGICSETGILNPKCFDSALEHVKTTVENSFFTDFLQSEFNAKHQVDVLSQDGGRNVSIMDILENDVLLFHFTEFLENSEGKNFSSILEFWISANNFRLSNGTDDDVATNDFLRNDAVAIYDKFVSLQASSPLGFSSAIRSRIEEQICSSDGRVSQNCFDEALQLVVRVLHMRYVQKFINSTLFKNYISELLSIISSSSTPSGKFLRRGDSMSSLNTSSSECNVSISTQNTLLAATSLSHKKLERSETNFLDSCSESDHLWRRKQTQITNIGRVNSLGRYTSEFEAPPDVSSLTSSQMGSKIGRAVRRMMANPDVEKSKEELAWQLAGMIVRDITSRSGVGFSESELR